MLFGTGMALAPLLGVAGYAWHASSAAETSCRIAPVGSSAGRFPLAARALGLQVQETQHGDAHGYLAHRDLLFLRWYCHVADRDGVVIRQDLGFAPGT